MQPSNINTGMRALVCLSVVGLALGYSLFSQRSQTPLAPKPANAPSKGAAKTSKKPVVKYPANEIVMSDGMQITATTSAGKITITSIDKLTRSYTWEGATRSVEMWPRRERWNGSLGLYYAGPGEHWKSHNGITRAVTEEGKQNFKSIQEAQKWLRELNWLPIVYNDEGLVVGWSKVPERKQLNVELWQIEINGKKPRTLAGSQNKSIVVITPKPVNPYKSLVEAVQTNNLQAVRSLLAKKANPNLKNAVGSPVLVVAVKNGNALILQTLLRYKANPNLTDGDGNTPLIKAVANTKEPLVKLLLDYKANPNLADEEGNTPLMEAAQNNHAGIAKLLLAHGAKVDASYQRGMMAGNNALMVAASIGADKVIPLLLKAGTKVNSENAQGETALQLAAIVGNVNTASLLLKAGANVDSRDWYGMSPLMKAAMTGNVALVNLLIKHGANVNARDDANRRSYGRSGFIGDEANMRKLEASGVLNKRQENGMSVLEWADASLHPEIGKLLRKAGAK